MRVNNETVSSVDLPLPPLGEQRRIVEELEKQLSRLDAAVEALRRAQRNLARYRDAVLKAACEGRLVPTEAELAHREGRDYEPAPALLKRLLKERRHRWEQAELAKMKAKGKLPKDDKWKAKYKEPATPNTEGLPELPEGWCWATVEQVAWFSLYGPRFSSDDYSEEGVFVLRTSDVSDRGKVNWESAPRLSLEENEVAKYKLLEGDLLFTRTGSIGRLSVFSDTCDAIPGAYLILVRLAESNLLPWWLQSVFFTGKGQQFLKGGAAGVGRPNLNAPTILSFPFPLPPLDEQGRIVQAITRNGEKAEQIETALEVAERKAEALRQSLLREAFSGRLVPQDPTEEPAEALLERIRHQRNTQPRKPARKARKKAVTA